MAVYLKGLTFAIAVSLAASAAADIAGVWTLTIDTPRGITHPTLTISSGENGHTGLYQGARGELVIPHIENDGNTFSFPLKVTMPMGEMELEYSGSVDGDSMSGEIGNPMGTIPFTGKREG